MKRNKVIGVAILTAMVGGVLFFVLRGSSEDIHDGKQTAALSPARSPARHRLFSLEQLYAEGQTKAGGEGVRPDGSKVETQASTAGLDDAVVEVLDSDPQLRRFHELRRKTVRAAVEQQDYLAMIADAKLIAEARKDLLAAAAAGDLDQAEELRRLQRIEFLNSALAWEDNPARAQALEAVTQVVMAEIPTGAPNAVTGSVLGDKFDLFQLLMVSDPDQAKALLAKARGTSSEKILLLAWQTGSAGKNKAP